MRPIKPPMMGRAWSAEDLQGLKESLCDIASEQGAAYAIELLDHGYRTTPLTAADYDAIRAAITKIEVQK